MKKSFKRTTIVITVEKGNGGRETWNINPVTRVVQDKTLYNRNRAKREVRRAIAEY